MDDNLLFTVFDVIFDDKKPVRSFFNFKIEEEYYFLFTFLSIKVLKAYEVRSKCYFLLNFYLVGICQTMNIFIMTISLNNINYHFVDLHGIHIKFLIYRRQENIKCIFFNIAFVTKDFKLFHY